MARKRANGEGSIRKRSNGTWEARIMLGVDPKTGKKISKSLYGKTQKEVRDKLAAFQAGENGEEHSFPLPPPGAPGLSLPGSSMYAHGNNKSLFRTLFEIRSFVVCFCECWFTLWSVNHFCKLFFKEFFT